MTLNKKYRILLIIGTRPEAIKLAPVILAMKKNVCFEPYILATGQHREMLYQVLEVFNIVPDDDLKLMKPDQSLSDLTSRAMKAINDYLAHHIFDMVLVQGDTTTVFVASLAAFYNKIKVGHVEAGLRTQNKYSPFPEEINRRLVTHIADFHFAPTEISKNNLIREGISSNQIFVTGNTVIDALNIAVNKIRSSSVKITGLPDHLINDQNKRELVLITAHRRENFGDGIHSICSAISSLSERFQNTDFVYPVHLNPNVKDPVVKMLGNYNNIHLIEPVGYLPFVYLMERSKIILTDSGGIQEEAPSLGKPVLVMRDNTERPEAVMAGTVKLVGTDKKMIVEEASKLLSDRDYYNAMAEAINPYGDGMSSVRILDAIANNL